MLRTRLQAASRLCTPSTRRPRCIASYAFARYTWNSRRDRLRGRRHVFNFKKPTQAQEAWQVLCMARPSSGGGQRSASGPGWRSSPDADSTAFLPRLLTSNIAWSARASRPCDRGVFRIGGDTARLNMPQYSRPRTASAQCLHIYRLCPAAARAGGHHNSSPWLAKARHARTLRIVGDLLRDTGPVEMPVITTV
jgi:hypothetical protein